MFDSQLQFEFNNLDKKLCIGLYQEQILATLWHKTQSVVWNQFYTLPSPANWLHNSYVESIEEILVKEPIINSYNDPIAFYFNANHTVLTPSNQSDSNHSAFKFEHPSVDLTDGTIENVNNGTLTEQFFCPNGLTKFIENSDRKLFVKPLLSSFINSIQKQNFNSNKTVHVIFDAKSIKVFVLENNDLLYYNHFHCHGLNDFTYFVMLVYNTLELDVEAVPLILSGTIVQESPVYHQLEKYVRIVALSNQLDSTIKNHLGNIDNAAAFFPVLYSSL